MREIETGQFLEAEKELQRALINFRNVVPKNVRVHPMVKLPFEQLENAMRLLDMDTVPEL